MSITNDIAKGDIYYRPDKPEIFMDIYSVGYTEVYVRHNGDMTIGVYSVRSIVNYLDKYSYIKSKNPTIHRLLYCKE